MNGLGLNRYALMISAATALLAGCGGSPPSNGAAGVLPESRTLAQTRVALDRIQTTQSSYQVIYRFGGKPDGLSPIASLIDVKGVLYGTTLQGGTHTDNAGTIFSVTTAGTERVRHDFGPTVRGKFPAASLIDVHGTLYGTTTGGGTRKAGTVFSISKSGKERALHSFTGFSDGVDPAASLIDMNGTLYGTTRSGGGTCKSDSRSGCGTVFSITPSGTEKVLHSFGGVPDGDEPKASLIDVKGTLYGTTYSGGAGDCYAGCGTVFSITPSGTEQILFSFGGSVSDGRFPQASLIDVGGTLYGTTTTGGVNTCGTKGGGCGTVFSITTGGTEKILHSFGSNSDGYYPEAALIDVKGTLYGTTSAGGAYKGGTIFSISTSGMEQVVYNFGESVSDGVNPVAALIDIGGTLYGTTQHGGSSCKDSIYGCGTVFALTP